MLVSQNVRAWLEGRVMRSPEGAGGGGSAAAAPSDEPVETGNERGSETAAADEDQDWTPTMEDIVGSLNPRDRAMLGQPKKAESAEEEAETEETEEATAEETTAEETETAETEETAAAEAETAAIEGLTPELQAKVNARIGEIVKQRTAAQNRAETAEAETATLKQQLATTQSGPLKIEPTPEIPLGHVTNAEGLTQVRATATAVRDWCLRNPDGGEIKNDKGETVTVDKAAVANHLADATRALEAIPQRRNYLEVWGKADTTARQIYPEAFQAGSAENGLYQGLLRGMPWILKFADHSLMICDAIAGQKARLAKQGKHSPEAGKAQAAALAGKTAPKVHGGPAGKAAAKVPAKTLERSATETRVLKGKAHPTRRDVESGVEAMLARQGY